MDMAASTVAASSADRSFRASGAHRPIGRLADVDADLPRESVWRGRPWRSVAAGGPDLDSGDRCADLVHDGCVEGDHEALVVAASGEIVPDDTCMCDQCHIYPLTGGRFCAMMLIWQPSSESSCFSLSSSEYRCSAVRPSDAWGLRRACESGSMRMGPHASAETSPRTRRTPDASR